MICPDCGIETDKLTKLGTCRACYQRFHGFKNRNVPYVRLIDLKGTKEYENAMERRGLKYHTKVKTKTKPKATSKELTIEDIKKKAKDEVLNDINHFKKLKDIKDLNVSQQQLIMAFDFLYMILNNNIDKSINVHKQIYDSLMIDYFHEVKPNNKDNDLEFYALHGAKEAYLQELRTPILQLDKVNNIISKVTALLKMDHNFMINLSDTKKELDDYLKTLGNEVYCTSSPSMQKYDFVINRDKPETRVVSKPHIQNKYSARIRRAVGIYGDTKAKPFEYKPPIYADSEEEAKEKFVDILLKDFGSLSYDTDDIEISLYTNKEYL